MPATVQRFSGTGGEFARRLRARQARARERLLHDDAMRDPGVAEVTLVDRAGRVPRGAWLRHLRLTPFARSTRTWGTSRTTPASAGVVGV